MRAWLAALRRWLLTPRVTTGIRAELILLLAEDGTEGILMSQLAPEEDMDRLMADFLRMLLRHAGESGATLSLTVGGGKRVMLAVPTAVPKGTYRR